MKMTSEGRSSAWLGNQLLSGADHLLVIDVRSPALFKRGHVRNAINLSCSSDLMLRRLKRGSMRLECLLQTEAERQRFAVCGESSVILYDGGPASHGEIMTVFANRLAARCRHICWLEGGYTQFVQECPELCESSAENRVTDFDPGSSPAISLSSLRISSGSSPSSLSSFDATPSCSPRIFKGDPAKVMEHLYLGDEKNASDRDTLLRYNIRFILNVTDNLPNAFERSETMNIEYCRIPVRDCHGQSLTQHFKGAAEFIGRAVESKSNILVHCVAGISRSVTMTLAYLMLCCEKSFDEAFDLVKKSKSNVSPNFSFLGQLMELNSELGRSSVAMPSALR